MMLNALRLRQIIFSGPNKEVEVSFKSGVNVVCGASETGKSFLAEAIDFMLGAESLKEIPERTGYSLINLKIRSGDDDWALERAISGGNFVLTHEKEGTEKQTLKAKHADKRTDNLSGYLLDKIGLLGKRILKNATKGVTISLSFRNIARLIVIQDGEIQTKQSPFLSGQFILKNADLATLKLLLTGVDDSAVVSSEEDDQDASREVVLLDELIADISSDITDAGHDKEELEAQLGRLNDSVGGYREQLHLVQREMDEQIVSRRNLLNERNRMQDRIDEIVEMLERFRLLREHYDIDKERLASIQESGSLFVYIHQVACPMCGADPQERHLADDCDGDVAGIVAAADAESRKIDGLIVELDETMTALSTERDNLEIQLSEVAKQYADVEADIRHSVAPDLEGARSQFSELVETRSSVQTAIAMHDRLAKLKARRSELVEVDTSQEKPTIERGIPDSVAHAFSMKLEHILRSWHFPGDCRVHFDKSTSDFVIDGKPRGSRGQGLRAITHAAITIGLMEFCQENNLPHPGFVVLDSPLLAYYEPEGDDDTTLQGSDLKEQFYEYLKTHHSRDGQVIIIDNQHPPASVQDGINTVIFTRNPTDGRFGLL